MSLDPNVVLPFASSMLSFVFFVFLIDQWRERRRPYQLIWAAGMLWYGLSAGTEFLGGAYGWSEPLYRAWYLIGAVWVAAWLGLGTVYLLAKTRFGYAFAVSVVLAGLFSALAARRYDEVGASAAIYLAIAVAAALAIAVLAWRGDPRWAHVAGIGIVGGSAVSLLLVLSVPLPAPGWIVDPATDIPTGDLFPGYIRLLTPLFNITGAFALSLGAAWSAYTMMPKRRVVRYAIVAGQSVGERVRNLLIAPVAIVLNFIVSLPQALVALFRGRLHSRVPATLLIALGGLIPAITSGLNRFGATSAFFLGELLGVVFLFAGFLVSLEVFGEIRLPFTRVVLLRRREV
jgi:hypothetical protein